jgi:hypothetical protein
MDIKSDKRRNFKFMSDVKAAITAVGGYVPEYVLTNKILESMVDTNDEWITARTGIKERRILKEPHRGSSYLGIRACEDLLKNINKTRRFRFSNFRNCNSRYACSFIRGLLGNKNRGCQRVFIRFTISLF